MLTINDWIAFLSNEKNSNISNIIGFTAFLLAAFVIVSDTTNQTWIGGIATAFIGISLLIVYWKTVGRIGRHARTAGRLLNDIMTEEERDPLKIEERWKEATQKK